MAGLLVVAAMVSGCANERMGADFASMSQKVGPPKPGSARIVVLREKAYGGIADSGWDVKLDGAPLVDLKTGTYVYADRPTGKHQLSAEATLFPGVTQHDFAAASGRTYFFLARLSDRYQTLTATTAVGGLAGFAVGAAVTSNSANPGPLDFILLDEPSARAMINDLRLAPS